MTTTITGHRYYVVDPDGTRTDHQHAGPAREHADRTGGTVHVGWYQCGACGQWCQDYPGIEHAGRCFPERARPEPAPTPARQLDLFSGAT